jgi:hypothetical protein
MQENRNVEYFRIHFFGLFEFRIRIQIIPKTNLISTENILSIFVVVEYMWALLFAVDTSRSSGPWILNSQIKRHILTRNYVDLLDQFFKCEKANSQIKRPRITRSACTTLNFSILIASDLFYFLIKYSQKFLPECIYRELQGPPVRGHSNNMWHSGGWAGGDTVSQWLF